MAYYDPILKTLAAKPEGINASILIRHSERYPILHPDLVFQTRLTPSGIRIAKEFGKILGNRYCLGRLISSPVDRCIATVDAIAKGAGWTAPVISNRFLGHPFIESAWNDAQSGRDGQILPGSILQLTDLLLEQDAGENKLDIFVTHDTVVGAMAHYYFGETVIASTNWPNYLEGIAIWREPGKIQMGWRQTVLDVSGRLDEQVTTSAD
jgi:broad specificity phosphatase PhoE